jgi:inhibitor of KinA sporulation pathway (predicted exonuclease)
MKTLVIFDLEATCWENRKGRQNEIIEIGAVRIARETGTVIDTFEMFIKPRENPVLSEFCKELTTIRQKDIDLGYDFVPAMFQFNKWLEEYDDDYIMSWGYYDKNQILRESTDKNADIIEIETKLVNKHLNIKNQFAHIYKVKRCGLKKALKILKLDFDGTHHRGIDDSENIAKIYRQIKDKFFDTIYDAD